MKRILISAFAALAMLSACDKAEIDLFDSPLTDAGSGSLSASNATISMLDFSWQPIDGVYQYGYSLAPVGELPVRQGVTKETSLHFDNLESGTDYELTVEAYGFNGQPTTRFSTHGSTLKVVQLQAPDVERTVFETVDGMYRITWPAVLGAQYYDYELVRKADGFTLVENRTTDTSLSFNSLAIGSYILKLTAGSDDETYLASDTSEFEFSRLRQVESEHEGTYVSATQGTYQCTLKIYDDGAYVIESFYGTSGYDLEFTLVNKVITISNSFKSEGNERYVATGPADGDYVRIVEDPAFYSYTVLPSGKRVKLYVYVGDSAEGAYDTFTWK